MPACINWNDINYRPTQAMKVFLACCHCYCLPLPLNILQLCMRPFKSFLFQCWVCVTQSVFITTFFFFYYYRLCHFSSYILLYWINCWSTFDRHWIRLSIIFCVMWWDRSFKMKHLTFCMYRERGIGNYDEKTGFHFLP